MPNKAKTATDTGAYFFVEHYVNVQNYATATGDTEPMRRLYDELCTKCEALAEIIEDTYKAGGHHEGEQWKLKRLDLIAKRGKLKAFELVVRRTAGNLYPSAGASPTSISGKAKATHRLDVDWIEGEWQIVARDPNQGQE